MINLSGLILSAAVASAANLEAPQHPPYGCPDCTLQAFQLDYDVSRNGKQLGQAQLSLRPSGGSLWVLEMQVEATKGLASVAGYRETERSTLRLDEHGWQIVDYQRKRKVAFGNRDEHMRFDWDNGRLDSEIQGEPRTVALPPGTVDSNSLTLLLGHQLSLAQEPGSYSVARSGKVDQWRFALADGETIDGFAVHRLDRIREDSRRTTTSWFSPAHGYLPIRLQQVEKDGETITMTLRAAHGAASPGS